MSSIRVVCAEIEGSDLSIQQALAQILERGNGNGRPAAPVAAAVIEAPPRKALGAAKPGRRSGKRPRQATESAAPAIAGDVQTKLASLLAKGPQTSGTLIRLSGLPAASVYNALHVMRKAGAIESRRDADSLQKNWLKG